MTQYIYFIIILIIISSCRDLSSVDKTGGQNVQLTGTRHHATTEREVDQLFAQLKIAKRERIIRRTQDRIRELWTEHPDPSIDTLMQAGIQAMYSRNYESAIEKFDIVIRAAPDFAEGWNRRATVFFMMGDFQASLDDIRQTLRLEGRHFGALSGMASIYVLWGNTEKALQTYEKLHQLIPQLREVNLTIKELRTSLGYRRI